MMMAAIRDDLAALNVAIEVFFSERSLIEGARRPGRRCDRRRCGAAGHVYEGRLPPPKGAPVEDWEDREQTLFRATAFGDDVDRPLKKSDGSYTYFASDIAYHKSKFERGFRNLIDVWGADHGGYVKRMKAAVEAISGGKADLDVKIVQLVQAAARRRAGQDVEALRRLRHPARGRRRGRPRRRALHDAVPQERRGARLRPRQGDRAVARQSRCSTSSTGTRAGSRCSATPARPSCRTCRPTRGRARRSLAGARLDLLTDPAEVSLMRRIALYPAHDRGRRAGPRAAPDRLLSL